MEKIVDRIWWIAVVMLMPLSGASIMISIRDEIFDGLFWLIAVTFILLAIVIGSRIYNMENRKDK